MVASFYPRIGLAQYLVAKYLTGLMTVERKTSSGWVVVASSVPASAEELQSAPISGDPNDARIDRVRTWRISAMPGDVPNNISMADRVTIVSATGQIIGPVIISKNGVGTLLPYDVAEGTVDTVAVASTWVTFHRYNQNTTLTTQFGPYPVSVTWTTRTPITEISEGGGTVSREGVLVATVPINVQPDDRISGITGATQCRVVEVRPTIADRTEVVFTGIAGTYR